MLQCLTYRELGLHSSHYLEKIEKSRRSESIILSQTGDFEQSHTCGVNSVDIDPIEGRYLLSCSSNSKILIHDTVMAYYKKKFKCEIVAVVEGNFTNNHKHSIETIQWYSEDTGMFLTSSSDKTLKVWDTNALQVVESFGFEGIVYHHQIGRNTKKHCLVAVGCEDSRVYLCDLKTGSASHILRGHNGAVLSVAWSPRNQFLLASGSRDNKVLLWDIRKATGSLFTLDQHNGKGASHTLNTKTAHNGHVNSLIFSSNGLFLVTYGTDHRLRLWDTYSGKNTLVNYGRVHNPSHKSIQCAVTDGYSSDLLFVPSSSSIIPFEVHSGKKTPSLNGHYNNVTCCTFQKDYQVLYSGSNDCHLLSWLPDMEHDTSVVEEEESVSEHKEQSNPYKDSWSSDEEEESVSEHKEQINPYKDSWSRDEEEESVSEHKEQINPYKDSWSRDEEEESVSEHKEQSNPYKDSWSSDEEEESVSEHKEQSNPYKDSWSRDEEEESVSEHKEQSNPYKDSWSSDEEEESVSEHKEQSNPYKDSWSSDED